MGLAQRHPGPARPPDAAARCGEDRRGRPAHPAVAALPRHAHRAVAARAAPHGRRGGRGLRAAHQRPRGPGLLRRGGRAGDLRVLRLPRRRGAEPAAAEPLPLRDPLVARDARVRRARRRAQHLRVGLRLRRAALPRRSRPALRRALRRQAHDAEHDDGVDARRRRHDGRGAHAHRHGDLPQIHRPPLHGFGGAGEARELLRGLRGEDPPRPRERGSHDLRQARLGHRGERPGGADVVLPALQRRHARGPRPAGPGEAGVGRGVPSP